MAGDRHALSEKRRDEKLHIENPRRFMLVIDIICVLLFAIALFFGIRYILNELFRSRYKDKVYSDKYEESLLKVNIPESYLPYYNLGNVEYQNGEYDKAIADYKNALELAPSHRHEKECDIRVNLALAMLAKIDWANMKTQKDAQRAIRQLKAARNVLTEEGCANPDDDQGHNEEAEQLKADIDKMLEEMQQDSNSGDSDNDEQQEGQQDQEEDQDQQQDSQREKDIQDALDEQKKNSMKERQETQEDMDNQQSGGGYNSYNGKTW
jgi:Tetratricopeptide repeat.